MAAEYHVREICIWTVMACSASEALTVVRDGVQASEGLSGVLVGVDVEGRSVESPDGQVRDENDLLADEAPS